MSTNSSAITVRGIAIQIDFKEIKHLHLGVYPPDGKVRVAAPGRMTEDQVRLAVIQRLPWIRRNRLQLRNAERQSPRQMVSGETHYIWGIAYRLRLIERPGRTSLRFEGSRLLLEVPPNSTTASRLAFLEDWMRAELRERLAQLVPKCESLLGVTVPFWNIRKMRTKWGTCNPDFGRIWFNLELCKKDPACLEYIVVHEMTHLFERHHNDRFVSLMDRHLPDWRSRRAVLNSSPLKHEGWNY